MDHATKAKFVLALHKHSLQALDSGGPVGPTTVSGTTGANTNPVVNPTQSLPALLNPAESIANTGAFAKGLAADFTTQNDFQAQNPYSTGVLDAAYGNTNQVYGQEQALAAQLAAESRGEGPNPAAIATQNAMARNAAQAQALAASSRGVNPGLAMRNASEAASAGNAEAGAAGAQLSAQQQLAAQGQLAGVYGNTAGQQLTQQQLYDTALNNSQGINAGIAQNNANAVNKTEAGFMGGASSLLSMLSKGGVVSRYADGGGVPPVTVPSVFNPPQDDQSSKSQMPGLSSVSDMMAKGGMVAPQSHVGKLLKHGKFVGNLAAKGGKVSASTPSQKAVKKDDSTKNDKVPALLSEDEIVIPRSITTHPQAPQKAAEFVQATLAKRRMGKR